MSGFLGFVPVAVVDVVVALIALGLCVVFLAWRLRSENTTRRFVESIFNHVAEPVFVKDRDHRCVLVNDAYSALTGKPGTALVGKNDYELFPETQVDVFWQKDDLVFETGEVNINEEVITDRDGVVRTIVTKKTLHVSPSGKQYIVGVIHDITDRKRAEEEVRALHTEIERLRAEWSAVVAHDLRQPLGAILLSAQMLARSTDDPVLRRLIEGIRSAASRLNRMVDDLMDLSRLDAQRLELVKVPVDVPALLRECVERMALQAPERPFDVQVLDDVSNVEADPDRLAQVMENLLTNAVKYGDAGTPIVVQVAQEDGMVVVGVTNQGKPISREHLSRLFERFQRFQRTSSAKLQGIEGTGLGLYITRALVEAHGGRVAVESTDAGVTTFRFTIPVAVPGRDGSTETRT